jgi:D-lactate dehydrogenase
MTLQHPSTPESNAALIERLKNIVGGRHVLTSESQTERYRKGFRSGGGKALAVVFPQTLLQQWQLLQACVEADKIVIMQAANTGLTEGSTPSGEDYDRDIIIFSTLKLNGIQLLDNGKQVIGFPGSTLYELEKRLKPLGREPHSVIGSSVLARRSLAACATTRADRW